MLNLPLSLEAWGSPRFEETLKQELIRQAYLLPLQQGLAQGSAVSDAPVTVIVHRAEQREGEIDIMLSVFYTGIISGCSCAGDPGVDDETTEHCRIRLCIQGDAQAVAVLEE